MEDRCRKQHHKMWFAIIVLLAGLGFIGSARAYADDCVALGGSLYQDIGHQIEGSLHHEHQSGAPFNRRVHPVQIEPASRLAAALGATSLDVNSLHHQSIKELAPGLQSVGQAPDGVVEAVEGTRGNFVVAVQFHPEWMLDDDARMLDLFRAFVSEAAQGLVSRDRAAGENSALLLKLNVQDPTVREP